MVEEVSPREELVEACLGVMETAREAADRMSEEVDAASRIVAAIGTGGFSAVVDALRLAPSVEEGLGAVARATGAIGLRALLPDTERLRTAMVELVNEMQRADPVGVHDVLLGRVAPALRELREAICVACGELESQFAIGRQGHDSQR